MDIGNDAMAVNRHGAFFSGLRREELLDRRPSKCLNTERPGSSWGRFAMSAPVKQRPSPLGLFPDQPTLGLYDRTIEVLPIRHYPWRTETAYAHTLRHSFAAHLADGYYDILITTSARFRYYRR